MKRTHSSMSGGSSMEISIKTMEGKTINLEVDDTSNTMDLKIHGPIRELALRLGQNPGPNPGREARIRIIVTTLKGKTWELEVERTEKIAKVMAKIHEQGGPPVDKQRLLSQGRQLKPSLTLADYSIKNDSELVMMSQLCGC